MEVVHMFLSAAFQSRQKYWIDFGRVSLFPRTFLVVVVRLQRANGAPLRSTERTCDTIGPSCHWKKICAFRADSLRETLELCSPENEPWGVQYWFFNQFRPVLYYFPWPHNEDQSCCPAKLLNSGWKKGKKWAAWSDLHQSYCSASNFSVSNFSGSTTLRQADASSKNIGSCMASLTAASAPELQAASCDSILRTWGLARHSFTSWLSPVGYERSESRMLMNGCLLWLPKAFSSSMPTVSSVGYLYCTGWSADSSVGGSGFWQEVSLCVLKQAALQLWIGRKRKKQTQMWTFKFNQRVKRHTKRRE